MSDCQLLTTSETAVRLKEFLKARGPASLAVAFWGRGAIGQLGLDRRSGETRVLCNLFSGGCNPDEIIDLLKLKVEVRYVTDLHAKVYCTSHGVIVGSSNASANGLGFEGDEVSGNIELNVLITEKALRGKAQEWFDRLWEKNEDNLVDETQAESVRPIWRHRAATLLRSLAAYPDSYRRTGLKVLVYTDEGWDGDDRERQWLDSEGRGLFTASEWDRMDRNGYYDFYSDDRTNWPVQPGTIFLDFHWGSERTNPRFQGLWRVRKRGRWGELPDGTRIITCDRLSNLGRMRFPKSEQRQFTTALKRYLDNKKRWGKNTKVNHYNHLEMGLYDFWKACRHELMPG